MQRKADELSVLISEIPEDELRRIVRKFAQKNEDFRKLLLNSKKARGFKFNSLQADEAHKRLVAATEEELQKLGKLDFDRLARTLPDRFFTATQKALEKEIPLLAKFTEKSVVPFLLEIEAKVLKFLKDTGADIFGYDDNFKEICQGYLMDFSLLNEETRSDALQWFCSNILEVECFFWEKLRRPDDLLAAKNAYAAAADAPKIPDMFPINYFYLLDYLKVPEEELEALYAKFPKDWRLQVKAIEDALQKGKTHIALARMEKFNANFSCLPPHLGEAYRRLAVQNGNKDMALKEAIDRFDYGRDDKLTLLFEIKELADPKEWPQIRDRLIDPEGKRPKLGASSLLTLFEKENLPDRFIAQLDLLGGCDKESFYGWCYSDDWLKMISEHFDFIKDHPEFQVPLKLEKRIFTPPRYKDARHSYRFIGRALILYQKFMGGDSIKPLLARLAGIYTRHPAMRDELKKLGFDLPNPPPKKAAHAKKNTEPDPKQGHLL